MLNALVLGGGKIARGFIGQLLFRSGYSTIFVDVDEALVERLNRAGKYYVNVMGAAEGSEWIERFRCLALSDEPGIAKALAEADVVFTAVGGKNLDSLAFVIAQAFLAGQAFAPGKPGCLITCENWKDPARQLEASILRALPDETARRAFQARFGVTEAVILRSGIEPTPEVLQIDENAVSVTNFWELPVDAARMKGAELPLQGLVRKENFEGFLQQKLFTFNTSNATIAYIGTLKGHRLLSDAANDPEIVSILEQVLREINPAIASALGVPLEQQVAFSHKAVQKYQDTSVTDFTERHARDPVRKIGPNDRIVGTARLVEEQGGKPDALALTLAAAIFYRTENEKDPTAGELASLREQEGVEGVLTQICGIGRDEPLLRSVLEQVQYLREKGWISNA